MSKNKKIQIINFFIFFLGWVIIFLLGADFPPPVGFLWLVMLILILDIIQSLYLNKYFLKFIEAQKKIKLFFANLLFYLFGGLTVSLFTAVPLFTTIGLSNCIIWIIVVTIVSIVYGIIFWFFNYYLYHIL